MIYALARKEVTETTRREIAQGIADMRSLREFVGDDQIVHVMQSLPNVEYYCIYCLEAVRPSMGNVQASVAAKSPWYYTHCERNECIGKANPQGLGLLNTRKQGCYLQLGSPGYPQEKCHCISDSASYCHHAVAKGCVHPSIS